MHASERLCNAWSLAAAVLLHDRPHLRASEMHRGKLRSHLDSLVQVPGVDEEEPANLFLRFGKGPVRDGHLAVPTPHGHGLLDGFERPRRNQVAVLPELVSVGREGIHERATLLLGHCLEFPFLDTTQEQIFHGSLPPTTF